MSQEQKPAFVVQQPFMGVVVVQMNSLFSALLQQFIDEADAVKTVEPEIWALRRALNDPAGSRAAFQAKQQKPRPKER